MIYVTGVLMKIRDIVTEPMLEVTQDDNLFVITDRGGNYETVLYYRVLDFLNSLDDTDKKRIVLIKRTDADKDGEYPIIWIVLTDKLNRGTVDINIVVKADDLSYGALADREISDFIPSPNIMAMVTDYFSDDVHTDTLTIGDLISKEDIDINRVLRSGQTMVYRAAAGRFLTMEETVAYFDNYYNNDEVLYANEEKVMRFWHEKDNSLSLKFIEGTGYRSSVEVRLNIGDMWNDYTTILQQSFSDYIGSKAILDWIKTFKHN